MDYDWTKLTAHRAFISDLGESQTVEINGEKTPLGRYAAWTPVPQTDRHQVVEVSGDLEALKLKYKVSSDFVFELDGIMEG